MSKVRASSHEYPYVEKSRIFGNRISKVVQWPTTVMAKELTSPVTAKRITSRQKEKDSRQKEKPHGKKKKTQSKKKTSRQKEKDSQQISSMPKGHFNSYFSREVVVILFAMSLFLFAVGLFLFFSEVMLLP